MFARLFLGECKQMLKCLTYYVVIGCIILFYVSQMGEFKLVEKPIPGQEDYGFTVSKDENVIMQNATGYLALEFVQNNYRTYPIGFSKTVTLNNKKQSKMEVIATEVTGLTKDELTTMVYDYLDNITVFSTQQLSIPIAENITYEHYKKLMKQADQLLGGGSKYSENSMLSSAIVPMTYEQALEEYEDVVQKDKLSGAYARMFSDYMGIVLGILPVFIAVTRGLRDRRARASEVIYIRKASSLVIMVSRYLAMLVMILLPIIMISLIPSIECMYYGTSQGIVIDQFIFMKYVMGWLLPTMMVSLSVGTFLTELTDTAIAIVVQGFLWFINIFMGISKMLGGYGWNLIPRHNIIGNYQTFQDNFNILVTNRITYTLVAILLVLLTVMIYEWKRGGKLKIGKIHSNRKSKSKV